MSVFRENNLVEAWLVLVMALVFGVALTGIDARLSPMIDANKKKETMDRIPSLIPAQSREGIQEDREPETLHITSRKIAVDKNQTIKFYTVYDVAMDKGGIAGHVAKASGKGYADNIEVLVGFDSSGKTITGLFVLDQKETPGLGNKIMDSAWRNQFAGKSTDRPFVVVKSTPAGAYEIDGISGATISSRSVTEIVNHMVSDIRDHLVLPETTDGKINEEDTP